MSERNAAEVFYDINRTIHAIWKNGGTLTQHADNIRPQFHVLNFDPLVMEKYGLFRRAPLLAGKFAVKGFFWRYAEENPQIVYPYLVVDSGKDMYGCSVDGEYLTTIGDRIGLPYEVAAN